MIVIADTTPLNYLVLIEHVEVLAALYTRVVVPETVALELKRKFAPVRVRPDPPFDLTLEFLDPGERAALSLAELLSADEVLIDDWAGRTEAKRRHIRVTGTLTKLRATNFRLSAGVERLVRQLLAQRIGQP